MITAMPPHQDLGWDPTLHSNKKRRQAYTARLRRNIAFILAVTSAR
jgi:hypothetical protein